MVPRREDVVDFRDVPPPPGASALVAAAEPEVDLVLQDYDEAWLHSYAWISQRVREALGFRVLSLEHIGSTAVPGLPAKPIIDVDLVVADPDCEEAYLPALESTGFVLRLREPWWYRHRMLRLSEPRTNLHVFGYDSPEPLRHRIFRDWLRVNAEDRALYASAKLEAVRAATSLGEDVMRYNERKSKVLRAIYGRAFVAAGLLDAYP